MRGGQGKSRHIFVLCVGLLWLALMLSALTDHRTVSVLENRTLASFQPPTGESLLSGSWQENLETALGDHLPGSEQIRDSVRTLQAGLLAAEREGIEALAPALRNGYTQLAEGYYSYRGDRHRIVEKPVFDPKDIRALTACAQKLDMPDDVRSCLYLIHNSRSVDFDHPEEAEGILDELRAVFSPDAASAFSFRDYEEFSGWFYQTDHHWNRRGAYRGYTEILSLLKSGEQPVSPSETITFPFVFNGSYARQTHMLCADEPFEADAFSLPKMAVTLNGKRGVYGRLDAYRKGKYTEDPLTNHYANCFGGEYGEIIYENEQTGRGSLLLIASSYSNPINGLLASHFDKTCVIDPRYYAEWAGHPFDPVSYAAEKGLDTLLLLGDIQFFLEDLPQGLMGEGGAS